MQPIKTALLSFGMSGKVFHAPFIHLHEGFQLLGAWERSKKLIAAAYPGARSYGTMAELLNDSNVELVIVNTPTYTHYEYAKMALLAGKHVVVEKAFTTTAEEAVELQQLAGEKGLKLSVFQNRRWDSDFKTVRSVVEEGLIGEIVEASIAFARYKAELSPKTHKEAPGPGAGILKDLGAHVIDQALCLFGMPKAVFADIGITRPESTVDDYFDILLRYDDKRVHVKGGYFFREPTPEFAFHGTKGTFLKSRSDVQEDQLQAGKRPGEADYGVEDTADQGLLHTGINGEVIRKKIETLPGNYMDFYEAVYQSIANDKQEPVTAQDGINVMRIIDAAFESDEHGRVVGI